MPENHNSITFDEESRELQIITWYDKQAYLDTCFREVWPVVTQDLLTTKDKALRKTSLVRKLHIIRWLMLLVVIREALLFLSDMLLGTLSLLAILSFAFVLLVYLFIVPIINFIIRIFHLTEKLNRNAKKQWEIADQLFTWSASYKQEIHITQTERCAVETSPYVPMAIVPGREYLKVLHTGDDVFFLQYGQREKTFGLLPCPQTLHFKAQNYTAEEWSLLLAKLTALSYL